MFRIALRAAATLLALGACTHAATPRASASAPPASPSATAPDWIAKAEGDASSIADMRAKIQSDPAWDQVEHERALVTPQLAALAFETSRTRASNPSLDALQRLDRQWGIFVNLIRQGHENLAKAAGELGEDSATLDALEKEWNSLPPGTAPPPNLSDLLTQIAAARGDIAAMQARIAACQTGVSAEEARATEAQAAVNQAENRVAHRLLRRDSPPLWAPPSSHPPDAAAPHSADPFAVQAEGLRAFALWQEESLILNGLLFLFVAGMLCRVRHRLRNAGSTEAALLEETQVLHHPVSTALVLSVLLGAGLYPVLPGLFESVLGIIAIVPAALLLRRLAALRYRIMVYGLVVFYILDRVRAVPGLPPLAGRIVLLVEMMAAGLLAWHGWRAASQERNLGSRWFRTLLRAAAALLGVGCAAVACGWVALATYLAEGVFGSAYLAMLLMGAIRIVDGLALGATRIPPLNRLHMVEHYRTLLAGRIHGVTQGIAAIFWATATLELFSLRSPLVHLVRHVLHASLTVGALHVSLSSFCGFILALWAAMLFSRFLRFVLEEDVYPRVTLGHGLPYAISTMIHYAILTLALVLATTALGLDMTKLTILVSALGVGIGFGLQTIINNFVSGIILLFERPIKVGDSIQVDEAIGAVERIGIRASVLRTPNGSEIIVPNGTLISDRVTNWTLSDRRRIVVIPFNVARGPDPVHLIDLMKATAAAHPAVSKNPPPEVQATNLAATLSFELRVWTDMPERWTNVRSDLMVEINAALAKENIAIA